jgi:hypothetical protein
MYPKAKYINIFESQFVRSNKTGRAGATYATNSDMMVTLRLDSIVSIHTEKIEYSHHRYCTVVMANRSRYNVTEETAEAIRLCLNIDSIHEERGEQ